jgi:hypothetical protein
MKKKGGGRKKVVGVSAKADGSAGTPKKNTTTSAKQTKKKNPPELSDIEESPPIDQRKPPPWGYYAIIGPPHKAKYQPPAHDYIGNDPFKSTVWANVPSLPPFDSDIQPLDHTSPHKHPPASFVAAAACAASPANTLEDDNEAFNDLVGEDTSGLDDLSYSSAKDDEDFDDNMEKTACETEYSNRNGVNHGWRQTNFIPGGPKPPKYDGMNDVEKTMAKQEYKRERKKFTDGLRLKWLKDQNDNFDPEAFSGCLTLGLRTMVDVQNWRLEVNHTFPNGSQGPPVPQQYWWPCAVPSKTMRTGSLHVSSPNVTRFGGHEYGEHQHTCRNCCLSRQCNDAHHQDWMSSFQNTATKRMVTR